MCQENVGILGCFDFRVVPEPPTLELLLEWLVCIAKLYSATLGGICLDRIIVSERTSWPRGPSKH